MVGQRRGLGFRGASASSAVQVRRGAVLMAASKGGWPRCTAASWRPDGCGTTVASGADGEPHVSGLCQHHLEAAEATPPVVPASEPDVSPASVAVAEADAALSGQIADLRGRLKADVSAPAFYRALFDSISSAVEAQRVYQVTCRSCGDRQAGQLPDLVTRISALRQLLDLVLPKLVVDSRWEEFQQRVKAKHEALYAELEQLTVEELTKI